MLLLVWVLALGQPAAAVAASDYESGTYTIDYTVLKAENDSASMANDYWEKPATVIVDQGKLTVRMKINHSQWVTDFKTKTGSGYDDVKVISTDEKADTRVTEFAVTSLEEPLLSKIHVTVESIDYDHDYTIRFRFDLDTLKLVKAADSVKPQESSKPAKSEETAKPGTEGKDSSVPAVADQQVAADKPAVVDIQAVADKQTVAGKQAVTDKQEAAEKPAATETSTAGTDRESTGSGSKSGDSAQQDTKQAEAEVKQENSKLGGVGAKQDDSRADEAVPRSEDSSPVQPSSQTVAVKAESGNADTDQGEPIDAQTSSDVAAPAVQAANSSAGSTIPIIVLVVLLALSGLLLARRMRRGAKS